MQSCGGERRLGVVEPTVGHFALVAYIPGPLARFLDELRLELTPGCNPHAHVTILPPRPIFDDLKETMAQLSEAMRGVAPFRVELDEVEIFRESSVIYVSLRSGEMELRQLYAALNNGAVEYQENFPYHPHITIGQNLEAEQVEKLLALARATWANWTGPRGFTVSRLSFVQQVAPGIWADVAELPLGVGVPVPG
jgi:2'-5' RNA ligase